MLYIIAGKYKGFKLNSVLSKKTRSTSHLFRKACFDTIGNFIEQSVVLDLFSGSGAYGFEALSRNAKQIYLVDNFFLSFKTMQKNKIKLKLNEEQVQIFHGDAFKMLKIFTQKNIIFDLIIIDPPYFFDFYHLIFKNLDKITNNKSLIVFETHYKTLLSSKMNNFILLKDKKYGSKKIYFYKKFFM